MRIAALLLVSAVGTSAQTYGGSFGIKSIDTPPAISNVSLSPAETSIVATWDTASQSDSEFACGTSPGTYPNVAADNAVEGGVIHHTAIVAGLTPATPYFCRVQSVNTSGTVNATSTSTTNPAAASTPINGVSYGTFLSIKNLTAGRSMYGDTFYNARGADGNDYLTTDDTGGWTGGGYPAFLSNMQVAVFEGTFPAPAHGVNGFSNYGKPGYALPPDGLSAKQSGMFAMQGKLFTLIGRQLNSCCSGYVAGTPFTQFHGEIIWSPDYGKTWNTWQNPSLFTTAGYPTTAGMFPSTQTPSNFASATFVMYGADDGTLGYKVPINRHNNGDAYVYLIGNEKYWNNGSNFYIARVARAKLARLQASDYQYFTGGDGNLDANWSSSPSSATAIVTAANSLSEPAVQYIAALNRYILLNYYYPQFSSGNTSHSVWNAYESPTPWGPWTLKTTTDNPSLGWYNPIILNSTAYTGTTPTIFFSGDFNNGGTNYNLWYATMTIQ